MSGACHSTAFISSSLPPLCTLSAKRPTPCTLPKRTCLRKTALETETSTHHHPLVLCELACCCVLLRFPSRSNDSTPPQRSHRLAKRNAVEAFERIGRENASRSLAAQVLLLAVDSTSFFFFVFPHPPPSSVSYISRGPLACFSSFNSLFLPLYSAPLQ